YSSAVLQPADHLRWRGNGREFGQHESRMNQKLRQIPFRCGSLKLVQVLSLVDSEFTHCRPRQFSKMRSWPKLLSQLVRKGTQISSGTDPGLEPSPLAVPAHDFQLLDFDILCLELHFMAFACQFVGRNTVDLLRRERRWKLLLPPDKIRSGHAQLFKCEHQYLFRLNKFTLHVISIRCQ